MVLDSEGRPHIAYGDRELGRVWYARWTGSSWHTELLNFSTGVTNGISLALDSHGLPHIVYYDYYYQSLWYANNTTGQWRGERLTWSGGAGDAGLEASMVLDSHDMPHISYYWCDVTVMDNCYIEYRFRDWTTLNWSGGILFGTGAGIKFFDWWSYIGTSIDLDSKGYPHIAAFAWRYLAYVYFDGLSWQYDYIDCMPEYTVKGKPSLVLDRDDYPHISYYNDLDDPPIGFGWLIYAVRGTTHWSCEYVDRTPAVASSIVLDSRERPHIFFANGTHLTHTVVDGSHVSETVDPEPEPNGYSRISAVIGANDSMHVVYWHHDLDLRITSLRYAHRRGTLHLTAERLSSDGGPHVFALPARNSNALEPKSRIDRMVDFRHMKPR